MPGRLIMDQQGAIGSTDLRKDRSKAQEADLPPKPDFAQHHVIADQLPNGVSAHPSAANGYSSTTAGPVRPPQLDQSWRESGANKSMGKLIDRLAEQCFEDLSGQITRMAEEPILPQEPRADDAVIRKKRGFMDFAHGQRDRFIKTLVLSDWARHAGDDMAKLVDLKVWQEKQSMAQLSAIHSIGVTKHTAAPSKVPNPNIEGALQVLSTGKASSKVPHLGFLPPERLTAEQLLRTLQGMNVSLATRLNLNEDLPSYFNDFSVADGRATFRVPGEFEVDLSLADEELSSPFYFIDIRFLFSPAPKALDEIMRGQLEMRTNAELATKGLQGCYNFLHNFVLTHKLTVLKSQAQKLASEKWFDCLGIEWKNRVLTLHYWKSQSGKKSWLEFGICTGKKKTGHSRRPPTTQLTVRWFRKGQLVEHDALDIDWNNLDTEKILSEVIAKHTTWLLIHTKSGLEQLAGASSKLEIDLATSTTVPEDCSLKLQLPSMQEPLLVRVEPVTGWTSLSPPTERVIVNERGLNRDVKANPPRILAYLTCKTVEDRVGKAADLAGWKVLDPRAIKQDNFKTLFGTAVTSWKPYKCSNVWDNGWIVIVTYSLSGEKWWVARLEQKAANPGNTLVTVVTSARQIPTCGTLAAKSCVSRTSLLQIEKLAVSEVSFMTLSQQLASMQISHRLEKQASLTFEDSSARIDTPPIIAVFFRGAALLKDSRGKDLTFSSIKIIHQGLVQRPTEDDGTAEARQEIRLSVDTGNFTHLKEFLATKGRDTTVGMTESGALAIRLRTPFGQPYYEKVLERLRACEQLDHYLAILQHFQFECIAANLRKLTFTYARSPDLSASFTFPRGDGCLPASLRLEPVSINPHNRTRVLLEKLFNSRTLTDPFPVLCKTLANSVGIMRAFEKMEATNRGNKAFSIHPRNPLLFTLTYQAPLAALSFRVELIDRKEKGRTITMWKLKPDKTKQELSGFEAGRSILQISKHRSKDLYGFEDGSLFALSSRAIAEALDKIDNAMRNSTSSSNGTVKQEGVAKTDVKLAAVPAPAAPKKQPPQQKPAQQKAQPPKPMQQKPNGVGANSGPRTMTANTNATPNTNSATARNNQTKVKNEIIELD